MNKVQIMKLMGWTEQDYLNTSLSCLREVQITLKAEALAKRWQ